jgi:hypothetical protein
MRAEPPVEVSRLVFAADGGRNKYTVNPPGDSEGKAGAVVRPVSSISSGPETSPMVRLDVPLESLGDPYPALRELWNRVSPGGAVTVTFGGAGSYRLKRADTENLLRLAGFDPQPSGVPQREITARRLDRSAAALFTTVVVPCRNEVDNVARLVDRVPAIGTQTEILFVDGSSTDGTPERIERLIRARPDRDVKLIRQEGNTGKAGATFQGLAAAQGDVVMILDADMTVRPEDLPRFYFALAEDVADFANGSRLIYPMESGAMPGLNNAGNRVFSRYLSWLMGCRITDTLCGTKAMRRRDVPALLRERPRFGGHDPWGDFDLLLGAASIGLSIVDVPVRYVARDAGESKMRPWAHGSALARTCLIGARRLKLERHGAQRGAH